MGTSITAPTDPIPVHSHPPPVSKNHFLYPYPQRYESVRLISYTHLRLSHPIYISSNYLCHDLSCHKHNSSTTLSLRRHTNELQEIANLMRTQCCAGWTALQKCLLRLNSPCLPSNHHKMYALHNFYINQKTLNVWPSALTCLKTCVQLFPY